MKKYSISTMSLFIGMVLLLIPADSIARSGRAYIKDSMKKWGECRTVTITETNGDAMIFGNNGYGYDDIPSGMGSRIEELNDGNVRITDLHLSENGNWIILYGTNGFTRRGLPSDLDDLLVDWNDRGYTILSASFDDDGHWIAVSKEKFATSDYRITQWVQDGANKYGSVLSACVSEGIAIVIYERGHQIMGKAPQGLVNAIKTCGFKVRIAKVTKSAWFISDGISAYRYYM